VVNFTKAYKIYKFYQLQLQDFFHQKHAHCGKEHSFTGLRLTQDSRNTEDSKEDIEAIDGQTS